jgi:hypothetical protein
MSSSVTSGPATRRAYAYVDGDPITNTDSLRAVGPGAGLELSDVCRVVLHPGELAGRRGRRGAQRGRSGESRGALERAANWCALEFYKDDLSRKIEVL